MQRNPTSSLANQMKMRDRDMVPRFLVQAMFALMLGAVALVGFARLTDRPLEGARAFAPVDVERVVTMQGDREAGVALIDATGTQIAHSHEARKGFIDVVWTAIARVRQRSHVDMAEPIRVVRRENGQVAILDDATGWSLELIGYGVDNVAAFADLVRG